ncbi:protein-disulfide isomerase [Streptacidiphilus sp. MAP12-16]|uniref:thioredoxin domain-containing protein n=1 Tax=Streptacidiphilus sp. MAP12-16 TaxID=3156300 RepID=UPI0035193F9E
MSRNSTHKPTESARDRMIAERRLQERTAARRRIALIALAAVVVVGAGTAISVALAGGSSTKAGNATSTTPLTVPANTSGPGGTVIVYGKADAPNTLDVYEDFRCPVCDSLERADGTTIQKLADDGSYKIQYHMGTFLDNNLGGSGSITALAAAGAALNESTAKFEQFRNVLYANQPDEQNDSFSDVNHLLDLAGKVPGLRTPAFDQAVRNGTYKPWAAKVSDAFNASGVTGTPTFKLNGSTLTLFGSNGPITPAQYQALVQQTVSATKK